MTLREVSATDYDYLLELRRATMRPYVEQVWGWDEAFQEQVFAGRFKPERLRVIELDGRAVGAVGFDLDAEKLYIGPLHVEPSMQGQGIGRAVLEMMFRLADERGVPTTLQVLKVNVRARKLYESLGFELFEEAEHHFKMRRDPPQAQRPQNRSEA